MAKVTGLQAKNTFLVSFSKKSEFFEAHFVTPSQRKGHFTTLAEKQ